MLHQTASCAREQPSTGNLTLPGTGAKALVGRAGANARPRTNRSLTIEIAVIDCPLSARGQEGSSRARPRAETLLVCARPHDDGPTIVGRANNAPPAEDFAPRSVQNSGNFFPTATHERLTRERLTTTRWQRNRLDFAPRENK